MSNLFSIAFLAYEIFYVKRKFEMPAIKKEDKGGTAKIILKECTPLFLSSLQKQTRLFLQKKLKPDTYS